MCVTIFFQANEITEFGSLNLGLGFDHHYYTFGYTLKTKYPDIKTFAIFFLFCGD